MAENELTSVILNDLRSQREWQQQTTELLRTMSERLAKMEQTVDTLEQRYQKQADDVEELESMKDKTTGITGAIGYVAAAAPGVIALVQSFLR